MNPFVKRAQEIFEQARAAVKNEKLLAIKTVLLIGKMKHYNVGGYLGIAERDLPSALGLTSDQYYKRLQAARAINECPYFLEMLKNGETHISHLALVAAKLTPANTEAIVEGMRGKSKREVEFLMSRMTKDGHLRDAEPTVALRITLKASELELLDRARDVLASRGQVP